jgi:hypothetical protein
VCKNGILSSCTSWQKVNAGDSHLLINADQTDT